MPRTKDKQQKQERQEWSYQGISTLTAKRVTGKVRAASESEALEIASKDGVLALSATRFTSTRNWLTTDTKRKAKRRDVNMFIRGYSTAASSNMRIEDALRIAATGIRSKGIQIAAADIADMYSNGVPLHEAFAVYSQMFGDEASAVMQAGESSGQTFQTLSALADSKERSSRIRGKIVSAMVYPAMLLIAAFMALSVVITVVIPKIQNALSNLGTDLPLLTRILVNMAEVIKGNLVPIVLIVILGGIGLQAMLTTTTGKLFKSTVALRMPIAGPVVRNLNTATLCELCGVMLTAGVTQTRTMELLSSAIRNHVIASELKKIPQRLVNGMELDAALKLSVPKIDPVIPALAQQTSSGLNDPGEPWRRYGQSVAEEADRRADLLKSAMEPIMIAVVGVLIGLIAAAVYLPLLKSYSQLDTL